MCNIFFKNQYVGIEVIRLSMIEIHDLLRQNNEMAIFRTLTSMNSKCFAGHNQVQAWI